MNSRSKIDYEYEYGPTREKDDSSDYVRSPPTTVDVLSLIKRYPKHKGCTFNIHASPKNDTFRGLYCAEHDHWFTWLNSDQEKWLIKQGFV
jgi:hypothetical protein